MLSSTNYPQKIGSGQVELNCSVSLILQRGQRSFSSFHLWICVVTKVNIWSIKFKLCLTNYLQVIWSGEVKLDCWVSLKYEDEEDSGLSKRIVLLCIYVKITVSVINTLHNLVVFNIFMNSLCKVFFTFYQLLVRVWKLA